MNRTRRWTRGISGKLTILVPAMTLLLSGCGGEKTDAVQHIQAHNIKQLMAVVVEPQAEIFWKSTGSISNVSGIHDLTPTTDKGWLATRSAAATIAEMGNLLMTPQYAKSRGPDWIEFAKGLVAVGQQAEKAAAARDTSEIMSVGETLYNVCSACHMRYPPADATTAGKRPGDKA